MNSPQADAERPKLLKPSGQTFAMFWPLLAMFIAFSIWPSVSLLYACAGFIAGVIYGYIRLFWQMEKVFGKEAANKIWVLFRGH